MTSLSVTAQAVETDSWYPNVIFTVTNHSTRPVDMNESRLLFNATARSDTQFPLVGSLAGDLPPQIACADYWPMKHNAITVKNHEPLWLAAGESAQLSVVLVATQLPIVLHDINVKLAEESEPQSKIRISFPALAETAGLTPSVTLFLADGSHRTISGEWGNTLTLDGLSAGNYEIGVAALENSRAFMAPRVSSFLTTLENDNDEKCYEIGYLEPVWFASAELVLDDIPEMQGASVTVELWRSGDKLERMAELVFGRPNMLSRLKAGERYEIHIQPTSINNVVISSPTTSSGFTPQLGETVSCRVPFQQKPGETSGGVTVRATILGLPAGVGALRYLFRSNRGRGNYQYSVMLKSGSEQQVLPMKLVAGQYQITTDPVIHGDECLEGQFSCSYNLLQSANNVTLAFEKGALKGEIIRLYRSEWQK